MMIEGKMSNQENLRHNLALAWDALGRARASAGSEDGDLQTVYLMRQLERVGFYVIEALQLLAQVRMTR